VSRPTDALYTTEAIALINRASNIDYAFRSILSSNIRYGRSLITPHTSLLVRSVSGSVHTIVMLVCTLVLNQMVSISIFHIKTRTISCVCIVDRFHNPCCCSLSMHTADRVSNDVLPYRSSLFIVCRSISRSFFFSWTYLCPAGYICGALCCQGLIHDVVLGTKQLVWRFVSKSLHFCTFLLIIHTPLPGFHD
jgi:hypothetical protein